MCERVRATPVEQLNPVARQMYARRLADQMTRVRVGVAVLVRDTEGRILLEKRKDSGVWGFPGGRIEAGETVAAAAVREIAEETGLVVTVTKLLGVYSDPRDRIVTFLDNGDVVHLIDIFLETRVDGGSLAPSPESEALAFFTPGELPQELVPSTVRLLDDVLQGTCWTDSVVR